MAAEAGWYPDPMGDATKLRYWDGAAWTDHYAPAQAPAASAPSQPTVNVTVQAPAQPMGVSPAASVAPVVYPLTDTDRTLRLIAFILNLITTIACCWLLVPLAWMIPMTVHTYSLYKGTRANTVGFGVCNLLFLNLVAGILLLCSNKEA